MEKKKFRVTFEIEEIPYNKDTYTELSENFMEDWDEGVYARMKLDEILGLMTKGCLYYNTMAMKMLVNKDEIAARSYEESFKEAISLKQSVLDTIKIEPIEEKMVDKE